MSSEIILLKFILISICYMMILISIYLFSFYIANKKLSNFCKNTSLFSLFSYAIVMLIVALKI